MGLLTVEAHLTPYNYHQSIQTLHIFSTVPRLHCIQKFKLTLSLYQFSIFYVSKELSGMLMWNMLHLPPSQVFHSALGEPCRISLWDHTAFSVRLHILTLWISSALLPCPSGYPSSSQKVRFCQTWQTSSTRLDYSMRGRVQPQP